MFESASRHLEIAIWKSQEEGWREEWMLWEWKCGESEMAVCKVSGKVGTPSWVLLPLRLLKWRVSNSFCYFAKMSFLLLRWPSAFLAPLVTYSITPCFIMGLAFLCCVSNSHIKSYTQCKPKRKKSSTASEQPAWPMFQLQGMSG